MMFKRVILLLIAFTVTSCTWLEFEEDRSSERAAAEETRQEAAREAEQAQREEVERLEREREEAGRRAVAEAERAEREQAEAERRAREEAEKQAQQEAERQARERAEAERKAQEEAERLARERAEAERKAQEEAERQARERAEAERKAQAEAERKAKEEAERQAAAERRAREEAAAQREREAASAAVAASAEDGFYLPDFSNASLDSEQFTPMGGERAGNEDGTIPAWTGNMRGVPDGLQYSGSGDVYPDPYADESPLFTVHSGNLDEHRHRLSEGLVTMLKKYPDTFYMHIYPSHRDGRFSDLVERRTAWNEENTQLVNGVDGLGNYTGGAPFPFPSNANEVLWNGRIIHPNPTLNGTMDDVAVYLNGNRQLRRQEFVAEFPFAHPDNEVGTVDDDIGVNAALVHVTVERPERQRGQMTIIHEALDQVRGDRMAWVYIPGSRRVRRAPTVGYDTPDGPGGLMTVDDALGFNGAMDRYNWELLGKKEMYVPFHAYKFDDPKVTYERLLQRGHANPEYMRYELQRVWVVEAELKRNARHVYAKRRFYIHEDSWHIVLLESYDGRGDLWRIGILNTLYDYAVQGYIARAQMFHDMQSGGYVATRLVNETAPLTMTDEPQGESYYSPANLRSMGR